VVRAAFKVNDQPVQVISHGGGINGFATVIMRFPKEKHLIVLLDNTSQQTSRLGDKIGRILFDQPYDPPKISIAETLDNTIKEKGVEAGIAQYRELKAKQPETYNFEEGELNGLGYSLMRNGKIKDALEIFKLNVEMYPKASNPYDSLAEAYANLNQKDLAIANYKKALELDPKNTSASEQLKLLEQGPVKVDPAIFDAYVGEYELAPGFVLRVYREGEKFMTQATGQGPVEILATSETTFSPKTFPGKLTFVKDPDGKVTSMILSQNGRDVNGKKIK
jgi:tetratricopeptide (TPR) repeat protein